MNAFYLNWEIDLQNFSAKGQNPQWAKMGYDTFFKGEFRLNKPLNPLQKLYLLGLASTRRMVRNAAALADEPDVIRTLVGLHLGYEGEYYISSGDIPLWTTSNHHLFSKEFRSIVLTLLCVQKFHRNSIDKNVFYMIIRELALVYDKSKVLDYELPENVQMFVGYRNDITGVVNHNKPPKNQPGLWNQWIPNDDGTCIVWDGGEKFYHYVEWLRYITTHFLKPWGYVMNGKVSFQGEEQYDGGQIFARDNDIYMMDESSSEESDESENSDNSDQDVA
jgi:hypothetical protein